MNVELDRLIKQGRLRFGDKFRVITQDESLKPIYFIGPAINWQQLQAQFEPRQFWKTLKRFYQTRILEIKELRERPVGDTPYSLLGGCQLLSQLGQIPIKQLIQLPPGVIILSADGKFTSQGDYLYLLSDDGSYASFDETLYLKQGESADCLWILEAKNSIEEIQLEHFITGRKLVLSTTRIANGIWTIKTAELTLARHKSDVSHDTSNKRPIQFKLFKGTAEFNARLENQFRYLRYRLAKIHRYMVVKSSANAAHNWMKQIRQLTARIKGYVLDRVPEMDQSDRAINVHVQELCLRYEILYHLEEIVKLLFREKLLRTWPDAFMDIIETLRVASMYNHQNSAHLHPILDLMIRAEPDPLVERSLDIMVRDHRELLNYFHGFRPLGQKGNEMAMPLECLVGKLATQEEIIDRISCLRLLEQICRQSNGPIFLNQQGIFRVLRQQWFIKSRTLLSIQCGDRIYVQSFNLRTALQQLFQKADSPNIRQVLGLLQQQLLLSSTLSSYRNKQCANFYRQQLRPFETYFSNGMLNNIQCAAISRLILAFETRWKKTYTFHRVRILEEGVDKKPRNSKPTFLVDMPKEFVRDQGLNPKVVKEVAPKLLAYIKEFGEVMALKDGTLPFPFRSRLLLENLRLLNQLLLQRMLSVRSKKQNVFVGYFKSIFDRINLMRTQQAQQQQRQRQVQIGDVLKTLLTVLSHNHLYSLYLSKFGVKHRIGQPSLKDEAVKRFRQAQQIFKSDQDQIKARYQVHEADMEILDECFHGIEQSSAKIKLLRRVTGSNEPVADGLETRVKIEICQFLEQYVVAKTCEQLSLAFEGLEYYYKENQKFFKKKVKFRLDQFVPDPALTHTLGPDFVKLLLEQFYLASDPQLMSHILRIIYRLQTTCREFQSLVSQTLILTQRTHCVFLQSVRNTVDYLRDLSESCEMWLRVELPQTEFYVKEMQHCQSILKAINSNLSRLETTEDFPMYQTILHRLEIFSILFDIVSYIQEVAAGLGGTDLFQAEDQTCKLASNIFRLSVDILRLMITRNPTHQFLAYDLFYLGLYDSYTQQPRNYLRRFIEELIRDNGTLQLQFPTEHILYLLDNFVDNATIFERIVALRDIVARETMILRISQLMLADDRCLKVLDAQLDKAQKELVTADKYGLKHRTTDTIIEAKSTYLKILCEVVKFVARQKDTARANESFQMRLQLLTRIIKNCESLKKINLTPNTYERFINIKRLNLELFWQLFKVDAGILLQQRPSLYESYFISQLASQCRPGQDRPQYWIFLFRQWLPLMLILCNQYKVIKPQFKFTTELGNTLLRLIDLQPLYQQLIENIKKKFVVPLDFELYVSSMKHLVQGTIIPKQHINALARILDFEPQVIVIQGLVEVPVQPQTESSKIKSKTEIWAKAVTKLYGGKTVAEAKAFQRDHLLMSLIHFQQFYTKETGAQLQDDQYESVINSLDIFKKIIGLVMHFESLNMDCHSMAVILELINRIIFIVTNQLKIKEYKPDAQTFQLLFAAIPQKDMLKTALILLTKEKFQAYPVRMALLHLIKLIIEANRNVHTVWSSVMSVSLAKILIQEIDLTHGQYPYLLLKGSPEPGLVALLDIVICLYEKNIYLPLDFNFRRPRKAIPLFALSDAFMFTQLNGATFKLHEKILKVLSHYIFSMADMRPIMQKCRLTTNMDLFYKKLKMAPITDDEWEALFRPFTTFLSQGVYMNQTVRQIRKADSPRKSVQTGCLRFM